MSAQQQEILGHGKLWDKAVLIEKNARRNRWLITKSLLGELYPAERLEALRIIETSEHKLTQDQLKTIEKIIESSNFITIVPLE